jgi:hypothetical protein
VSPHFFAYTNISHLFAWMQPAVTPFKHDPAARQADLLRYLFCPVPVLHQEWRYSDVWGMEQARAGACDLWEEAGGKLWDEAPSAAHLAFWAGAESELESIAIDLIDTFFTIVDPRLPILDAHQFLARFQSPGTDPLPHALLAVVLAFGARFVDHNVFRVDREECTARDADATGRSRSRIVQLLVVRAREVSEMNKSCRIPSLANAQAMLLLEGLLCQSCVLKRGKWAHARISSQPLLPERCIAAADFYLQTTAHTTSRRHPDTSTACVNPQCCSSAHSQTKRHARNWHSS